MAKPFKDLIKDWPEERLQEVEKRTQTLLTEMKLRELRRARELTQQQLAETLSLNQAAVSKFERQSDMYISTLRRFLEAMGGELKIVAHFPDGDVLINQFEKLGDPIV